MFKSLALAATVAALIACAAQSKPRGDAVAAQRALLDKTASNFAACQAQYERLVAEDDRAFEAALRAHAKDADRPNLAELRQTVAETDAEFKQRDGALARKIRECDAIGREEMNARDRLWQLCHEHASPLDNAATEAEKRPPEACR